MEISGEELRMQRQFREASIMNNCYSRETICSSKKKKEEEERKIAYSGMHGLSACLFKWKQILYWLMKY